MENQTPSLIDNIFCNNISDEIISGNIYLTLSEHFSQFASVKRDKLDIKKSPSLIETFPSIMPMISARMCLFKIGI